MGFRLRAIFGALFTLVFVLSPRVALAQDDAPSDGGDSSGGEGESVFGEVYAEAPEPEEGEDEDEHGHEPPDPHADNIIWTLRGGGTLGYGNARTASVSGKTTLSIRRGDDVLVMEAQVLYGAAQAPLSCGSVQEDPTPYAQATRDYCGPVGTGMSPRARAPGFNDWADNILNFNWRLRYDHFTDPVNAFFLLHRGRIDRFAGIQPRLGLALGYSRLLVDDLQHTLALDLGVDATFDIYTDTIRTQTHLIADPPRNGTLANLSYTDWRFVPSVRVGLAYVNHLNAFLTYDTTFEALWDVANQTHFRFEWINHLVSAIDEVFQIVLDVTFRLDSLPPGQARVWAEDPTTQTTTMFEVISQLSLQGAMDLDGPPPRRSAVTGEDAPDEEEVQDEAEETQREIEADEAVERDEDGVSPSESTSAPTEPTTTLP